MGISSLVIYLINLILNVTVHMRWSVRVFVEIVEMQKGAASTIVKQVTEV